MIPKKFSTVKIACFISNLIQELYHSLHGDELSPTAENFEIHLDRRNFYIAD